MSGLSRALFACLAAALITYLAYDIRLASMRTNGNVLQNYDTQFNYRATEYLVDRGWDAFHNWYDDEVWYPHGRPTNSTMYPGMQYAAAFVYRTLNASGHAWSLEGVCCYISAWLAPVSALFTAGIAYEAAGGSLAAFAAAGFFMAIVPGHIIRSSAGGFDNEHVAIPAMCGVFFFWIRAIRPRNCSWFRDAILAGFCQVCIAWTWGGYIITPNIIGLSVLMTALHGKYSPQLNKAYVVFYALATTMSTQVPIISWLPFTSLELLGPLGMVVWLQLWQMCEWFKERAPLRYTTAGAIWSLRFTVFSVAGAIFTVAVAVVVPAGYFGPLSSRVRALIIQVPMTGNPLVDSVAEHRGTDLEDFWEFLGFTMLLMPIGIFWDKINRDAPRFFLWHLAMGLWYISFRMFRFMPLFSMAASAAAGVGVHHITTLFRHEVLGPDPPTDRSWKRLVSVPGEAEATQPQWEAKLRSSWAATPKTTRKVFCVLMIGGLLVGGHSFYDSSQEYAARRTFTGIRFGPRMDMEIMATWFRSNTPRDARIFAWWDYGYGINNHAKRTTLADGNTCNHEHIGLIGRALVGPLAGGHEIIRHLADYVWIQTLLGSDMDKAGHMVRIAASIFPSAVNASHWYFTGKGGKKTLLPNNSPSKMVKESLLYNLHWHNRGVDVSEYFEEVLVEQLSQFPTDQQIYRVFRVRNVAEDSRAYCKTHRAYPPGLTKIISQSEDFKQLEDFNKS